MAAGEPLTKGDLVPLTLTPLMGGRMSQKDRILNAFEIIRKSGGPLGDRECVDKLEAVIYTMAEKFLEQVDMEDVRKGVAMTRLGQMLIEEGCEQKLLSQIERKLAKGQTADQIAEDLLESPDRIRELMARIPQAHS